MNKKITISLLSSLCFSQTAFSASFDFVRLFDPNGAASVSVTSDGITATATTPSSEGLGVSFNQGLGVLNGGLRTALNNGDRIDITFDQTVDVEHIGFRQWGEGIGGDSANIISASGTQFLSGGGDVANGTLDVFGINLQGITELSIVGLGNVDNSAVGDFFFSSLDNVVLSGGGDTTTGGGTPSAVPVPAAVWLFGSGLLGLIAKGRRKSQV